MAQLPPDGEWLVQMVGDETIVFHRDTEKEIVRYPAASGGSAAIAQKVIHDSDRLSEEQKCYAHFWCGYFYAYASEKSK